MKPFDKQIAQDHFNQLIAEHNIKIRCFSVTSSGNATWSDRSIKIPHPTNIDRFGVCMHEIKHIIDGNKGTRFEQEFACDIYALEQIRNMDWNDAEWLKRTRWHILSRIGMAVNRGYHPSKIHQEIKDFFNDIDFNSWAGQKVYVSTDKSCSKLHIKTMLNMSRSEVEDRLGRLGKWLEISNINDSTYSHWLVKSNGDQIGEEFHALADIVKEYNFT